MAKAYGLKRYRVIEQQPAVLTDHDGGPYYLTKRAAVAQAVKLIKANKRAGMRLSKGVQARDVAKETVFMDYGRNDMPHAISIRATAYPATKEKFYLLDDPKTEIFAYRTRQLQTILVLLPKGKALREKTLVDRHGARFIWTENFIESDYYTFKSY